MSTSVRDLGAPASNDEFFDRLPIPCIAVDRNGLALVAANRAARSLFDGLRSESSELIGTDLSRLVHDPPTDLGRRLALAASGTRLSLVLRLGPERRSEFDLNVAGATAVWLVSLLKVRSTLNGFAKLNNQLSSRTLEALKQQRSELESAKQELEASQERLFRSNADLERFAFVAAHDLREPCRRQIGLVAALTDDLADHMTDEVKRQLRMLQNQGTRMLDLIDGLRVLSNLAGPNLELGEVPLAALVDDLLAETDLPAGTVASCDLPPSVVGYQSLITILFRNLIDNAVRHGERPLKIEIGPTGSQPAWFRFANNVAHDDEPGPDHLAPFVTGGDGDSTTSGLGLSVCTRVVQRHGGHILAERADGTFEVRFTLERNSS